jgi:hypothetical protein
MPLPAPWSSQRAIDKQYLNINCVGAKFSYLPFQTRPDDFPRFELYVTPGGVRYSAWLETPGFHSRVRSPTRHGPDRGARSAPARPLVATPHPQEHADRRADLPGSLAFLRRRLKRRPRHRRRPLEHAHERSGHRPQLKAHSATPTPSASGSPCARKIGLPAAAS